MPEAQSEQRIAPTAEYWPAAQVPDAADKPADTQTEPAGQGAQALCPEAACRVPAAQVAQVAETDAPSASEEVPAAQDAQAAGEEAPALVP